MTEPNLFSQWLRERRKALRLTQAQLAERAGISASALEKLEGSQRQPSQQVAEMLADALQIAPKERASFLRLAKGVSEAGDDSDGRAATPTNLPAYLTPLIGRDDALERVTALVKRDEVRLITLTGPPGVGKTRLALQAASNLLSDFSDGVFLVTLAPVRDPDLVVRTIAGALGLRDKGTEPISLTLKEYLRDQKVLLVLDNFEQVVAAAPSVVELLWGCPQVKMLVTSREALHVRGERQFSVPSLDSDASVQLFVQRAQEVDAGFSLTEENREAVKEICARMEGVPLAIELVAARVRLLPPRTILARLGKMVGNAANGSGLGEQGRSALPMLVGGARDLPDRHRTLRSAINWSYDLLGSHERTLFDRLGVFVGGFTLSAAEAVCNAEEDLSMPTLDGLESLFDKNLLKREDRADVEGDGSPRYTMLETIREYAAERLNEREEDANKIRRWHAEHFLALASAAESQITGPNQKQWLQTLEEEHDNLRAALAWTLERAEVEMGVRIACGLRHFWYVHSHMEEGLRWFDLALRTAEERYVAPSLLISALNDAGWLAIARSDYDRAGTWLNRSLALAREEGDPRSIASTLNRLAGLMAYSGKHEMGIPLLREALSLQRELTDKEGMARTYNNLATMALHVGDLDEAFQLYSESQSLFRELEDRWAQAMLLGNLGHLLRRQGGYDQAALYCDQSLDLGKELDSAGVLVMLTRSCQGDIARCQGHHEQALEFYSAALQSSVKVSFDYYTGLVLLGLACLHTQKKEPERAAILLGALQALLEKGDGALILSVDRPDYEQALAFARDSLEEAEFEQAWAQGREMSIDQLVSYV